MKKVKKELDFSGQKIYIGIDVHKKNWTVAIFVEGAFIKKFSMNPDPKELKRHLETNYPGGEYYSVYEAGFCGFWVDRLLEGLGIKNIVVNPADVPTTGKEKSKKTDARDARKLGRELMSGNLEGIYVPNEEEEGKRIFCRLYKQIAKDLTRCKNRIKSLLNVTGIEIPLDYENKHWSRNFIKYLEQIKFSQQPTRDTLDQFIEQLMFLRRQKLEVTRKIRKMLNEDEKAKKIVKHLRSIPGIGEITAARLYTEIIDINRFSNFDKLKEYVGLSPATWSTGEKERVLGISKRHSTHLRENLIESAWISIRNDPAMAMAFGNLIKKMTSKEAIIRIARKLLNRIRYVWRNETDYVLAVVE